jgi:hypothetical protein
MLVFPPIRRTLGHSTTAALVWLWMLTAALLVHGQNPQGQNPRARNPQARQNSTHTSPALAVDVIRLKSGEQIRGLLIDAAPDGSLLLAVERTWMQTHAAVLFTQAAVAERNDALRALAELDQRIAAALATAAADGEYARFLAGERRRLNEQQASLQAPDAAPLPYRFLWVRLAAADVRARDLARPEDRRVAVWAWSELLEQVATRTARDLTADLKSLGFDPSQSPPDLSRQLAPLPESEAAW